MKGLSASRRAKRSITGAAVTAVTVWACSQILVAGFAVERNRHDEHSEFQLDLTPIFAFAAGLVVMPLALWAFMRLLGEKKNALLITLVPASWLFVGGYLFDTLDSSDGHVPVTALVGYAVAGGVLSWLTTLRRQDARSDVEEGSG